MTPGDLVEKIVRARGLKVAPLARRAGVNRSQVHVIMRGSTAWPRSDTLAALAEALDVHPGALMPPGLTPLQLRAIAAAKPGGVQAARALMRLAEEVLSTVE